MNPLKDLLTEFCIRHPLMQHDETKNTRLFVIENGLNRVPEFSHTLPENTSPCALWDLMDDGRKFVSMGKMQVKRVIYFMGQTESGDNLPDREPEAEAVFAQLEMLAHEFRSFISERQDANDRRSIGIDLDFDIFPYGPLFNGWYAIGMSIDCTEIVPCRQYTLLPLPESENNE